VTVLIYIDPGLEIRSGEAYGSDSVADVGIGGICLYIRYSRACLFIVEIFEIEERE